MVQAPFQVIAESTQRTDIERSKGPTDVWRGYARIKQYIKSDAMQYGCSVRDLRFDQPFQKAADALGCTWNEGNLAYLGQIAECTLRCPYCYVDFDAMGKATLRWLTPREYLDDYHECCRQRAEHGELVPRVLRVSGGEPLTQMLWVQQLLEEHARELESADIDPYVVWIDTNLTIMPWGSILDLASGWLRHTVAFCGCFKPGQSGIDLAEQLRIVRQMAHSGVDLYLYYPSWGGVVEDFTYVLERLVQISPGLLLRLTPIFIDWSYEVPRRRLDLSEEDAKRMNAVSREWFGLMREMLAEYVEEHCPREWLWLPSNQVPILEAG